VPPGPSESVSQGWPASYRRPRLATATPLNAMEDGCPPPSDEEPGVVGDNEVADQPRSWRGRCLWKLSDRLPDGWRKSLGRVMESATIAIVVVFLILVDVVCAVASSVIEDTDLLNPKYAEEFERVAEGAEAASFCVLGIFLVEQMVSLVAFGRLFFHHLWHVLDLGIVGMSIAIDVGRHVVGLTESEGAAASAALLVLRLWKMAAVLWELVYLRHEIDRIRNGSSSSNILHGASSMSISGQISEEKSC